MDAALFLAGLAFVGATVALSLRFARRTRAEDAERVERTTACFEALAARRGLEVTRHPPYVHPLLGEVRAAPIVRGVIDGFRVQLGLEAEAGPEAGDEWTVLRLRTEDGAPDWPEAADAKRRPPTLPGGATPALEALCA